MRVRNSLRIVSIRSVDQSFLCVIILAVFFLGGSFAGFCFSKFCTGSLQTDIAEYLLNFCEIAKSTPPKPSFSQTMWLFFLYPVVVFFMGLSPLGMVVIPVLSFCLGFGILFTVQCFVFVFSRVGVYPALALLSVRLIVTLVCFLLLAVEALPQAWRIARVTIRNGKRCESICRIRRLVIIVIFSSVVLAMGVCCERFLTPVLFRFALKKIS